MNKTILFVFTYLIFIVSCMEQEETIEDVKDEASVDTLSFEEVEKNIRKEQKAEIFHVEKKSVIFFMISKSEANNLTRELGESYRWETDALFNNFIKQEKEFKKLLKKHNIYATLSHSRHFQIQLSSGNVVNFDRVKEDQIMGEIISDGTKQPIIEYGMYKNKELASLIQDFFNIENIGYVTPDTLLVPDTTLIPETEPLESDSVILDNTIEKN